MKTPMELVALVAVTTVMLAAVVACGKKDDAKLTERPFEAAITSAVVTPKASCDMLAELGTCNEYTGGGKSFGLEKSICEGLKGRFAHGACSTKGELGSCVMSDGEVKRYYGPAVAGDHALTLEEAKADCASDPVKGKFSLAAN